MFIVDNKINFLGPDWLKANQWHKVTVRNNTFGSFDSISLESPTATLGDVQCTFHHNSFTKLQPDSFKSISEKCHFTELMFKQNCACNFNKWLETIFHKSIVKPLESESFCSLDTSDTLLKCLKAETVKFDQYRDEICKGKRTKLKCDRVKVDKIDAKFIDSKVLSDDYDWMEYIHYIVIGAVLAILIPCACITIMVRRKSRNIASDHYAQGTMHRQTDLQQLNQSEGPPSYEASLRSTKTFSNRDHIIIKRTLETMKQKQPEDRYELVYNNTKRLLHEHLNEYEKVRIIGDIVQTIGECENSGEDFVAFTDILYKHLAPDTTTTVRTTTVPRPQQPIDDLYAEPGQPQNAGRKANSEHIYAEPTVLTQQQTMVPLLLANNYSNPLDSNVNGNNNNLYSEPVIQVAAVGEFNLNLNSNLNPDSSSLRLLCSLQDRQLSNQWWRHPTQLVKQSINPPHQKTFQTLSTEWSPGPAVSSTESRGHRTPTGKFPSILCHQHHTRPRFALRKTQLKTGATNRWRIRQARITRADQMRRSKSTSLSSKLIMRRKLMSRGFIDQNESAACNSLDTM